MRRVPAKRLCVLLAYPSAQLSYKNLSSVNTKLPNVYLSWNHLLKYRCRFFQYRFSFLGREFKTPLALVNVVISRQRVAPGLRFLLGLIALAISLSMRWLKMLNSLFLSSLLGVNGKDRNFSQF